MNQNPFKYISFLRSGERSVFTWTIVPPDDQKSIR